MKYTKSQSNYLFIDKNKKICKQIEFFQTWTWFFSFIFIEKSRLNVILNIHKIEFSKYVTEVLFSYSFRKFR